MQNRTEQMNLDWHRNKIVEIKKRGNLSILMPTMSFQAAVAGSAAKSRCLWPTAVQSSQSKIVSKRVWGR